MDMVFLAVPSGKDYLDNGRTMGYHNSTSGFPASLGRGVFDGRIFVFSLGERYMRVNI